MTEKRAEVDSKRLEELATRQTAILNTLIDISRVITTSHDLVETLEHTVELLADSLGVDVCSIYIFDEDSGLLVLRATHGLSREAVGHVSMPVQEGLVGHVFETKHAVNVRDVREHPRFKFFPGIEEERLQSFLGVPLIEYRKTLGVLTIQNMENRRFSAEEENLLITIASQISGLISKALLVDRMKHEADRVEADRRGERFQLEGIPIAPGLSKDKVVMIKHDRLEEPEYRARREAAEERRVLHEAIDRSVQEILALMRTVADRVSEQDAAIFHSHLLFLEDRGFLRKVEEQIERGASAAWAVTHVVKDYLEAFRRIGDPYLAERAADLEDVGLRLLRHLGLGRDAPEGKELSGVLVAEMLTPSDTAQLDPTRIKAIITAAGGHVSHAAILARSLRIPAVSGIEHVMKLLHEGEEVLVDGSAGTVFVNPDESIVREFERYQQTRLDYLSHLADLREVACCTKSGERVRLRANVGLAQDLDDLTAYGAEGVGLYRTEVYYLMRTSRPTVEELVENYARVLDVANDQPIVFRSLDLGGDRTPAYLNFPQEDNPYLGLRSIRYQLQHQYLLRDQIMALLHLAERTEVHLAVPMISHLSEWQEVKRIYNQCREEYAAEHKAEAPRLKLGMIFEVPASVLTCELFLGELDFVMIGSNDLTQYVMAVDRNNPHVSHMFDPLEPAVLLLVKRLVDAAAKAGKPVNLTGELASDPEGCLVLVGLGLRDFSMNAPLIPIIKDRLVQYTLAELEELAAVAMNATNAEAVRRSIQLFQHG